MCIIHENMKRKIVIWIMILALIAGIFQANIKNTYANGALSVSFAYTGS